MVTEVTEGAGGSGAMRVQAIKVEVGVAEVDGFRVIEFPRTYAIVRMGGGIVGQFASLDEVNEALEQLARLDLDIEHGTRDETPSAA